MKCAVLLGLVAACASPARAQDADPWFAPDKALHFVAGVGLAGSGFGAAGLATDDVRVKLAVSVGLGVGGAALKELVDLAGLGTPSWRDLASSAVGAVVGALLSWLIDHTFSTNERAKVALLPSHQPRAARLAPDEAALRGPGSDQLTGAFLRACSESKRAPHAPLLR